MVSVLISTISGISLIKSSIIETGNIIYENLNTQNTDLQLYKFEYENDKIDYFDENGKSMRKTLMKTPINGARLSSSFGKGNTQYLVLQNYILEQILQHSKEHL